MKNNSNPMQRCFEKVQEVGLGFQMAAHISILAAIFGMFLNALSNY